MTRTLSLVWVATLAATMVGVGGCKLAAGVKDHPNPTGAAGDTGTAGTGAAGTSGGTAGSGTAGTPPINIGSQYLNTAGTSGGQTGPCQGLVCQTSACRGAGCTVTCPAGQRTTVSGTIFDPAGQTPLYNITVYVPNAALDPINDGPSCDKCDPSTGTSLLSGQPVVIAKTDTLGQFKLGATGNLDVPAGTNVPFVIQVGKWQRQVVLPTVTPCVDNPITDMSLLHLPRTKAEGHIPKFALTTGQSDAMECLLRKIGIDDSEFTTEAGTGRVNFYAGGGGTSSFATTVGGGATFTPASPWWDSLENLMKYDILLHSCEGGFGEYGTANQPEPMSVKSPAARQALEDFTTMGGRVFASHWHAYWFEEGTPAFKSIGTFEHDQYAQGQGLPNPYDATIDQSFPTGMALAQWLMGPQVMGSTMLGTVTIAQDASYRLVKSATGGTISQRWIYASTLTPQSVQFLNATTPIAATPTSPGGTCGRAVISDLHVSAGGPGSDMPNTPFPMGCVTTTLSPREKVLEFMLFDIANCVAPPIP
jgi:hypothetical protein